MLAILDKMTKTWKFREEVYKNVLYMFTYCNLIDLYILLSQTNERYYIEDKAKKRMTAFIKAKLNKLDNIE